MSDWESGLKPIAVITRDSRRNKLEKEDKPSVILDERKAVIIDGKTFMIKKCSKIIDCPELFPIKHVRGGEEIYSCAYDVGVGKGKTCPKTHEKY